jgi:hypothetical protein
MPNSHGFKTANIRDEDYLVLKALNHITGETIADLLEEALNQLVISRNLQERVGTVIDLLEHLETLKAEKPRF